MDILTNIDDERFNMDSYDNYNKTLSTGYLMINDKTEMYSVFFIYEEELEERIMAAFEEFDDEDIFNIMQYSDDDGLVWIGFEDEDLVVYSTETSSSSDEIMANNYYNDNISDFISDLKQLESTDVVRLFIFKDTKGKDIYFASPGGLDEIYDALNKLGK